MDRPLRLDPHITRGTLRILADNTREKLRDTQDYEENTPLIRGIMRGALRDEHERYMRVINPLADPYDSGDPDLLCEDYALVLAEVFLGEHHKTLTASGRGVWKQYDPHPAIARFALNALENAQEKSLDRWLYAKRPAGDDPSKGATIY